MFKQLTLLAFSLFSLIAIAQENRFSASVFGGFTAAQVQGDGLGGFNKPGLTFGLGTSWELKNNFGLGFKLAYVQKGSRKVQDPENNDYSFYKMALQYAEIPVFVSYKIKKIKIYFGPSIAKLLKATEESAAGYFPTSNPFKSLEFGMAGGVNYQVAQHWSLEMGFQESLSSIRQTPVYAKGAFGRFQGQYNTVLNFTANFHF